MSGNKSIGLSVTAGNSNTFQGNIIGLNAAGNAKLPNLNGGVLLTGANNSFGGDNAGEGNTVSGNGHIYEDQRCAGDGLNVPVLFDPNTGEILPRAIPSRATGLGLTPPEQLRWEIVPPASRPIR